MTPHALIPTCVAWIIRIHPHRCFCKRVLGSGGKKKAWETKKPLNWFSLRLTLKTEQTDHDQVEEGCQKWCLMRARIIRLNDTALKWFTECYENRLLKPWRGSSQSSMGTPTVCTKAAYIWLWVPNPPLISKHDRHAHQIGQAIDIHSCLFLDDGYFKNYHQHLKFFWWAPSSQGGVSRSSHPPTTTTTTSTNMSLLWFSCRLSSINRGSSRM